MSDDRVPAGPKNGVMPENAAGADVRRLKRLAMRSWRRGMRETDLLLGPFADEALASMGADDLDLYEALLEENDQDLYAWIVAASAGRDTSPPARTRPKTAGLTKWVLEVTESRTGRSLNRRPGAE